MQTIISSGMLLAVLAMIAGISEGAVLSRCKLQRHMQEVFDRLQSISPFIKGFIKNVKSVRKHKCSSSQCLGVSAKQKTKAKCRRRGRESPRQSGEQTSYPPASQDEIQHTCAPIHLLQRDRGKEHRNTRWAGHGRPHQDIPCHRFVNNDWLYQKHPL